ncbi:MAG: 2-dehydro-3-deoxygalactonokinase [Phyllobacterium sp.]
MKPVYAAVDWGTSSFRLWLLGEDGQVLGERRSHEGMMHCASAGFAPVLDGHLQALHAEPSLPVIICGMAGARQGWQEAGYLDTPASLDALVQTAVPVEGVSRDIRILPGIAQKLSDRPDVMRGEETQLLGLGLASGLVCMPGTHSKWVRLDKGNVESFSTFMTGELFAVISRHSILTHAVGDDADGEAAGPAFLKAVRQAASSEVGITSALFSVRAAQLLGFAGKTDGVAHLSGVLIGAELAGARAAYGGAREVTLVASGRLEQLYRAALNELGVTVTVVDADSAVRRGLFKAARTLWPQT